MTSEGSSTPHYWSYVPFATRPRRRSSVVTSRPLDPHEKPQRYKGGNLGSMPPRVQAAWMNQGQRTRYIKAGCILAFVLTLLYFVAPNATTVIPSAGSRAPEGKSSEVKAPEIKSPEVSSPELPIPKITSLVPDKPASDGASVDGELTTAKCSKSYYSDKPLIQYALMIDAGSTGSRIHVYRFNNCGPSPELEHEDFEMTPKKSGGSGLSAYKDDIEGAAKSLDVLMEVAVQNVPNQLKSCTPVAVKATAGLRKLGDELSEKILKAVRHRLENEYPFPVVSEEHGGVQVMDGKDEGVYAWITTNYLLGKIGGPDESPTSAVFDLGGGSTQIVFQPTFPKAPEGGMPEQMEEGDHKYSLSFGGRSFDLYQHSYLGYGLMEARNNLHRLVVEGMHESNPKSKDWLEQPIENPCIAPGQSREIDVAMEDGHPLGAKVHTNMTGPRTGSPAQCRALAQRTLKKESSCKLAPCAFNGVHQPSLDKTFAREDIYLFSYFYDRIKPLGMPDSFTLRELQDLTERVCTGPQAWTLFDSISGAREELNGRPETCLDLNFMLALLHIGYEMPLDREVKIAKKIQGNELGWCLGAALPLLSQESGWQCKSLVL